MLTRLPYLSCACSRKSRGGGQLTAPVWHPPCRPQSQYRPILRRSHNRVVAWLAQCTPHSLLLCDDRRARIGSTSDTPVFCICSAIARFPRSRIVPRCLPSSQTACSSRKPASKRLSEISSLTFFLGFTSAGMGITRGKVLRTIPSPVVFAKG